RRFVVDDRSVSRVPKHGNSHSPCEAGSRLRVDLPEKPRAIDGIGAFADRPAVLKHEGIDIDHADRVIEAFQLAINEGSVRPGASPGNVKMIAAGLGGKP